MNQTRNSALALAPVLVRAFAAALAAASFACGEVDEAGQSREVRVVDVIALDQPIVDIGSTDALDATPYSAQLRVCGHICEVKKLQDACIADCRMQYPTGSDRDACIRFCENEIVP